MGACALCVGHNFSKLEGFQKGNKNSDKGCPRTGPFQQKPICSVQLKVHFLGEKTPQRKRIQLLYKGLTHRAQLFRPGESSSSSKRRMSSSSKRGGCCSAAAPSAREAWSCRRLAEQRGSWKPPGERSPYEQKYQLTVEHLDFSILKV